MECTRLANLLTHSFKGLERGQLTRIWHKFLFGIFLSRYGATITYLS